MPEHAKPEHANAQSLARSSGARARLPWNWRCRVMADCGKDLALELIAGLRWPADQLHAVAALWCVVDAKEKTTCRVSCVLPAFSLGTAVVPKPLSSGNSVRISDETMLEKVEDGKLVSAHHVRAWLILHLAPNPRQSIFENFADGRV